MSDNPNTEWAKATGTVFPLSDDAPDSMSIAQVVEAWNECAAEKREWQAACQRLEIDYAELEADRDALVAEALAHDCRQPTTPSEDKR